MNLLDYLNPLRYVLRVFSKERTPRQLALGAAIGLMIGLVPKGNLIAIALTMLLLGLKVNLGVGLITAFGVTCIGPSVDRFTHGIGVRAFETPWFYDAMRRAYQLPVVPWTSLNNTVVVGSVLLGLLLFYPTYHFGESAATALQPVWRRWRRRSQPDLGLATEAAQSASPADMTQPASVAATSAAPAAASAATYSTAQATAEATRNLRDAAPSNAAMSFADLPIAGVPIAGQATDEILEAVNRIRNADAHDKAAHVAATQGTAAFANAYGEVYRTSGHVPAPGMGRSELAEHDTPEVAAVSDVSVNDLSVSAWSEQAERTAEENRRVLEVIERLRGVQPTGAPTNSAQAISMNFNSAPTMHTVPTMPLTSPTFAAAEAEVEVATARRATQRPTLSESLARVAAAGESLLANAPQAPAAGAYAMSDLMPQANAPTADVWLDSAHAAELMDDESSRHDASDSESRTPHLSAHERLLRDEEWREEVSSAGPKREDTAHAEAAHVEFAREDASPATETLGSSRSSYVASQYASGQSPALQPTVLVDEQRTIVPYSQLLAAKQRNSSPRDPVAQFLDLLNTAAAPGSERKTDDSLER